MKTSEREDLDMMLRGIGPVHFLCPQDSIWPELRQKTIAEIPQHILQIRCVDGLDCWVTRTYYELRLAGYDVSIGPQLEPDRVNVAGVRHFGRRQRDFRSFVVVPRLDAHHPELANFSVEQNGLTPDSPVKGHVHHWMQPNIQPREPERGNRLSRIVYKGAIVNLDPQFRSDAFRAALAEMGVELVLDATQTDGGPQSWGDYRGADAVLAVRNLTIYDAQSKPASKLINAWWADVPALLGPEPAFQELRQDPLDYVEVTSVADVLSQVARLKAEPQLYQAMIAQGRKRRTAFTDAATRQSWVDLFEGPIAEAFARWQSMSRLARMMSVGRGLLREPGSKKQHQQQALEGPRILR